ncbi:MAG TPA: hypothetical protein DDY24_02725 [Alcaligenaceae bacterium]|nr:hypothetical protein [Alcaligenaceae bacterium]
MLREIPLYIYTLVNYDSSRHIQPQGGLPGSIRHFKLSTLESECKWCKKLTLEDQIKSACCQKPT